MTPARDPSGFRRTIAEHTPDSRRWRRRISGLSAVGAVLALYATFAIVSGVKSGMVYSLLGLLFGLLTLVLPAVAATVLMAPDSEPPATGASGSETAVETLKRRYATGEIDRDEFDRRLDDLVGAADATRDRADRDSPGGHTTRDPELDSAGQ